MLPTHNEPQYEVVIIGGGAAGLSAALTLARARRSVVVLDAGAPRNAPAAAAHGLIGLEGINPLELLERARGEARSYGADILETVVTSASKSPDGTFVVGLNDGTEVRTDQLVVATGVIDELPDIPGLAQRWGHDVVHCPYCHGWEIRDQRIGILATGPTSVMKALLFRQWSPHLWFLPNGMQLSAEQQATLAAKDITVVNGQVTAVVADKQLTSVRIDDGDTLELDALAISPPTMARLAGLEGLGVETVEHDAGVSVVTDAAGHTSIPGVWATGNVANPNLQVSEAAAHGARVAMTLNTELMIGAEAMRMMSGSMKSV